jgi:hypothetical protein
MGKAVEVRRLLRSHKGEVSAADTMAYNQQLELNSYRTMEKARRVKTARSVSWGVAQLILSATDPGDDGTVVEWMVKEGASSLHDVETEDTYEEACEHLQHKGGWCDKKEHWTCCFRRNSNSTMCTAGAVKSKERRITDNLQCTLRDLCPRDGELDKKGRADRAKELRERTDGVVVLGLHERYQESVDRWVKRQQDRGKPAVVVDVFGGQPYGLYNTKLWEQAAQPSIVSVSMTPDQLTQLAPIYDCVLVIGLVGRSQMELLQSLITLAVGWA